MRYKQLLILAVATLMIGVSSPAYTCGGCVQTREFTDQGNKQFSDQNDLQFYQYDSLPKVSMGSVTKAPAGVETRPSVKKKFQWDWNNVFNMYRQPHAPKHSMDDYAKNCAQLQQELNDTEPLTYTYKPRFTEDPYMGTATLVGSTMFWPAYGVVALGAVNHYQEKGRMTKAENRIETLRRLKAEKRCFEN